MTESGAVYDLAKAQWASSGLSDEHARALRFEALSAEETEQLGFQRAASLKLPYFDLTGNPTGFYRLRYLTKLPGEAGVLAKPQRYTQPPGTLSGVYLPPVLAKTWEQIAADSEVPILITEGEKKAACASVNGFPCIGLGGVDSWRASKRGVDFLPELAAMEWHNRKVGIVYDSDAATNANVVRAQLKLARKLTDKGALVSIVSLPPGKEGAKQGLDDLIVAGGIEAFKEVLSSTPGLLEAQALWGLNSELVYVRDPGLVIVRGTRQKVTPSNLINHVYANRHYVETTVTGDKVVTKQKPLAKRWVEWESRFEVDKLTYAPGQPEIHEGKYNTWPGWGVEPEAGDMGPWHWLMDFLFKSETESRKWFEQWCAYPLKYPGTKLYTTSVLWGLAKGTGKTLAAYALMKIYGNNAVEIKNKHLRGSFNSWAENRQLVYGDEITGGDTRIDADYVKGLITQHSMQVNVKYLPEYTLQDVINYIFSSNHPDAFFIEDLERRFFVHEVIGGPAPAPKYEMMDKWLHGKGPAALFDYLLQVNTDSFNPRGHAPQTKAAQDMALASKSDLGMWCVHLREDAKAALGSLGEAADKCDLYTAAQLLRAYDPEQRSKVTSPGVGRELRRAGFAQVNDGVPVRTASGLQRLWAVRNVAAWASANPSECAKHYDRFFGNGARKF